MGLRPTDRRMRCGAVVAQVDSESPEGTGFLTKLFVGKLRNRMICSHCGRPSDCCDAFEDLCLTPTDALDTALSEFTTMETLSGTLAPPSSSSSFVASACPPRAPLLGRCARPALPLLCVRARSLSPLLHRPLFQVRTRTTAATASGR